MPSGSHPTIQSDVNEAACTQVAIAAQTFIESVAVTRCLLLRGDTSAATVIAGQVTVTGDTTEVTLQNLTVNGEGCFSVALDVAGGAQVTSLQGVVVVNAAGGKCPIFVEGGIYHVYIRFARGADRRTRDLNSGVTRDRFGIGGRNV